MKYKLKAYSIWEFGKRVDDKGNPHQEDSIYPTHGGVTNQDRLFILCDGMGGHEAGEVASATVCEAMSRSILSAVPSDEDNFTEEILKDALIKAYDALDAKDNGTSEKKMGTTMTLLKLHNKGCTIAHIGDSRVYHIRPGKTAEDTMILFRTEDHSLVNELIKAGELTPEEAKLSRQKNVITRAMQPHMDHRPKADIYHTTDVAIGDYFYLCSDGMLENMEDEQLCYFFSEEAGDDEQKVDSLLKATQENRDNHSAFLVHITEVEGPIVASVPSGGKTEKSPLIGEVHGEDAQPLSRPASASTRTNPVSSTPKKSKGHVWLISLLVACIVVVVVALVLPSSKQKKTEKTQPPVKQETKKQEYFEQVESSRRRTYDENNASRPTKETSPAPKKEKTSPKKDDAKPSAPKVDEQQKPQESSPQDNQVQTTEQTEQKEENKLEEIKDKLPKKDQKTNDNPKIDSKTLDKMNEIKGGNNGENNGGSSGENMGNLQEV